MENKELKLDTVFLESDYLATRLRDFKEIKKGEVKFKVDNSSNENSKSKYIRFYIGNYKCAELRVSDHIVNTTQTQFIVKGDILSKKKKADFVRLVEKCMQKAKQNHLRLCLKAVGNEKSV